MPRHFAISAAFHYYFRHMTPPFSMPLRAIPISHCRFSPPLLIRCRHAAATGCPALPLIMRHYYASLSADYGLRFSPLRRHFRQMPAAIPLSLFMIFDTSPLLFSLSDIFT
jgi:hypothetical protein